MSLCGSSYILWKNDRITIRIKILGVFSLIIIFSIITHGLFWLLNEGDNHQQIKQRQGMIDKIWENKGAISPAKRGNYIVNYFTYGSGKDIRRSEYNKKVRFNTPEVDASQLLPQWKEKSMKWRELYWGFGVTAFPLNARVWMPKEKSPLPLILIVHGNHDMSDDSDRGYNYLGELLSSKGFITASVDENFLNGTWMGDFKGKEMPARAWLLLKHLELWNSWNIDPNHEFYQRVDMQKIMLIGHSRGGEASVIATEFNKLKYFPDNANAKFDFNFGIKGIVTLAPTDYRYRRNVVLNNINYLSLHGSYDAEVPSFYGLRQYQRLKMTDSLYWLKAGIYIHGANHSYFNSVWEKQYWYMKWLINKKSLISSKDQQQATMTFVSAFSQLVLNNRKEYLPLFQNSLPLKDWLPGHLFLNRFEDAQSKILLDFEQDMGLSKDEKGIEITTSNLKIWREEELFTRDGSNQGNKALVLGWDYRGQLKKSTPASYSVNFTKTIPFKIDSSFYFLISIAAGNISELPKTDKQNKEEERPDFSIELEDSSGNKARVVVSQIKEIAPRLKIKVFKAGFINKLFIGDLWEPNLETFVVPFKLCKITGNFNPAKLFRISIKFDQFDYGVVIIDDIGFGSSPPHFKEFN